MSMVLSMYPLLALAVHEVGVFASLQGGHLGQVTKIDTILCVLCRPRRPRQVVSCHCCESLSLALSHSTLPMETQLNADVETENSKHFK
jgi:hypothetical protein